MRLFFSVLPLVFLLACTGKADSSGPDSQTDTEAVELCPALFGTITASSVREYRTTSEFSEAYSYPQSWSSRTASIEGSAIILARDGTYVGDGYTIRMQEELTFTCDDVGVTFLFSHTVYSTDWDTGAAEERWVDTSYDPPDTAFPADATVGSTWATDYNVHSLDSLGNTGDTFIRYESALVADEDVTVPAGTFPSVRWDYVTSLVPDTTYSAWQAMGTGQLMNTANFATLVSYTP